MKDDKQLIHELYKKYYGDHKQPEPNHHKL